MIPGFVAGWKGIDETQARLAAQLPALAAVAPHLIQYAADMAGDEKPILLYEAYTAVLGQYPDYPAQQIGDCVSFGHAHGNDLLQCLEIQAGGDGTYEETDTEVVYGFAREISGDLGIMDGSYGAAAIKGLTTWGSVSRPMMGNDGAYAGSRAKEYGRRGCPQNVKDMAKPFLLGGGALCNTYDEIVAALRARCPVSECSNFLPGQTRDKDGFVRPGGSGGHCQLIAGVRFDRPGLLIINSWGKDYYSGPVGLGAPLFGYWLDRDICERRICGSGDNWAMSKTPFYKVKPWEWSRAA